MSDNTCIEKQKVVRVNPVKGLVYYRRNGKDFEIEWAPRLGRFPQVGDTLELTFGGHGAYAQLKNVKLRKPPRNKTKGWFRRWFSPGLKTNEEMSDAASD